MRSCALLYSFIGKVAARAEAVLPKHGVQTLLADETLQNVGTH